MTFSKKIKLISILIVIVLATCVFFSRPVYKKVDATAVKYHGYDDDFNEPNFSNVWTNRDSSIEVSYNALRFNGSNYWGGGLVATNKIFGEEQKAFIKALIKSFSDVPINELTSEYIQQSL